MRYHVRRAAVALAAVTAALAATAGDACLPPANAHLQRVATSGELRVCIWPEYYGISFHNAKSDTVSGVDADLARELASELKAQVRFVDTSFAHLIDDVLSDRCDVAMMGVAITPQRQEKLAFAKPHLRTDVYAVTTRNNQRIRKWEDLDRPGIRIGVAA